MSETHIISDQTLNDEEGWRTITDYSITKSYGGMQSFMASHNLKITNNDDIEKAKRIIDEMKKTEWENRFKQ